MVGKRPLQERLKDVIFEKKHSPRGKNKYDVQLYLWRDRLGAWTKRLEGLLRKYKTLKFEMKLVTRLQKRVAEKNVYIHTSPCFRTKAASIITLSDVRNKVEGCLEKLLDNYDVFMKEGSGWMLERVEHSQMNVYKHNIGGGGGKQIMKTRQQLLPSAYVKNTRSILTFPLTTDNKCFVYCVLASLHPAHKGRKRNDPRTYMMFEEELKTDMLDYPVTIDQIPEFERANDLAINVVRSSEKGDLSFLFKSERYEGVKKRINLLLHARHYSLISSWNCFLNFSSKHKRLPCDKCNNFYVVGGKKGCGFCRHGGSSAEEYIPDLEFVKRGQRQKFFNSKNAFPHPFVYYCDMETVLEEVPVEEKRSGGRVRRKKIHRPIAIGLMRVCNRAKKYSHKVPVIHAGKDCVERFYQTLREEIKIMDEIMATVNHPLHWDEEQRDRHERADSCYVCGKALRTKEKLRDHNHLKKKRNYLGPICNECNLNITDLKATKTPLIFHNGGKFDVHFLIQKLHVIHQPVTNLIGKSGENIMSMNLFGNRMIVMDSVNHLSASLASLVDIMKKSDKPLRLTARWLGEDPVGVELLSRKGVFPYQYVTGEDVLVNTTKLPPAEQFYDDLKESRVDPEDYGHAQRVWSHFGCLNLMDYMTVYLKSDVTLLADVFENYRFFFLSKFGLDSARYLSLPGLSYDCMLKYTKCGLDFIYDLETYNFLKRGLRGGVSMIPHRYAKANNPQLDDYDPEEPTSHLVYLDCNALYSSIMTKKMPYRGLKWTTKTVEEMRKILEDYTPASNVGYYVECDLKYPAEIHDLTKDLPLAPEHRLVTEEMLSPHARRLSEKFGIKTDRTPKLLSTQYDKEKYICHVENLQYYIEKGMILQEVHRVLQFKQKAILKPYIDLCINERNRPGVTTDEKSMWKLCCNAIFGKTITNVEKKNNLRLLSDDKKVLRAIRNPRFKHADVVNPKIVKICSSKKKNLVTTPYYVGVTILELSKLLLMKIHYDHFLAKYGRFRLTLCMTDTDSLLYHIRTEDLHRDLKEMGIVEFGNYPKDHPYYDTKNAGKLFYLKDESGGTAIKSFVGLRAKSYSLEYVDEKNNKITGKGIPRHKLKEIKHVEMLRVLNENCTTTVVSNHLRSFKHTMFSIEQEKVALSPLDNKRYVCDDGINTLPYGHADTSGESGLALKKRRMD